MAKIEDIALEHLRKENLPFIYYGDIGVVADIYSDYGGKSFHPLNRSAAVIGALARSKKWECCGRINHLGRWYNCYKPKGEQPND